MRFESVKAYAFGPFRNETLELAPGMNVVYGPNEAGKSSWHAALYAGLCGMRRARGQPRKEDRAFAERHRPWGDNNSWDVGTIIVLDDGRRVELRHDLAGRVDSSARDADLAGRDYSNEIMSDGSPDGARWLGLDRRSFLMTSCIRQADILGLLESPAELQDELQRAADTADRDGTAAEALIRLRDFRAESVGSARAQTKPLRVTEDLVLRTRNQLEQARATHREYLERWLRVDKLEQQASDQAQRLGIARATRAAAVALEATGRLEQARELQTHFPRGAPQRPSQNENLVRQVAGALSMWNQRPSIREPEGEAIPVLEAQLAQVTLHLATNAEQAAAAIEARLTRAREINALFPDGRPIRPSEDDQLVRRVASALAGWESRSEAREPVGPTVADLEEDLARIGRESDAAQTPPAVSRGPFAALFRAIRSVFAALLRLFGVREHEPSVKLDERRLLEEQRALIRQQIAVRQEAEQEWQRDAQRACEAADALQEAATTLGVHTTDPETAAAELRHWQQHRADRLAQIDKQMSDWEELQRTLGDRTLDELDEEATVARSEAVSLASRTDAKALSLALQQSVTREAASEQDRVTLLHQIDERHRQEREKVAALATIAEAEEAVAKAARRAGGAGASPDDQVVALRSWQDDRQAELEEADHEIEKWEELQRILGRQSLDELATEVERLQTKARSLAGQVGTEEITADGSGPVTDAELARAEREANDAYTAFIREQSQLDAFAQDLVDVAEAQEALAAAQGEYDRVQSLDRTLDTTIRFLEEAEERVHRTIAPVLAGTLREWLPRVTSGRYTDCRVDPEGLAVEVETANGHWQQAEFLSHGTAEQVYLLLRLALAHHLTREGCPLILDDAVAASDSTRKRDLLETLRAISESTQVILFTHEDDVCAWARERLDDERHALVELDGARALT